MKVATIIGTRPEIIRLSRVIAALDRYVEHVLIHTGQNYDYELNQVFFDDLEIRRPDIFLQAAGKNAAETIGLIIGKSSEVLAEVKPDAVLLLGDKVLFCTRDAFQKIDFSEKNAESRWLATAWLGALTTPPILSDGSVYFATAERGLICARQGKR